MFRTGSFSLYIRFLFLISPNRDAYIFIRCKGDSLGEESLDIERAEISGADTVLEPHVNVMPKKH